MAFTGADVEPAMSSNLLATYRIQFRPEFTLADAALVVPYLSRLGVSHLYASPILQSTQGSTHGYDVVDPGRINSELGGPAAFNHLADELRARNMGLVLDIVPNHMAISPDNPWWWDVLKNGPASRFASYFDVAWDPPEARHSNAVLLPVLGDHYGRVLEAGEVKLAYDGDTFTIHYFDHIYPVDPRSLDDILTAAAERSPNATLSFLAGAFNRLPGAATSNRPEVLQRYRDSEVLRDMLARLAADQPAVAAAIQEVLEVVNGDPRALDTFLRKQNYRLAYWKISSSELGYRRFFDINSMIGLRMEDEEVYRDTHATVLELLGRGALDGLRIDHPDGLRDPARYFARLRADAGQSWVVIEKILEPGERLPESWPVQGTTGYDFLNRVNGVLVDRAAEGPLSEFYTRFTGLPVDYPALMRDKKRMAAREVLGSDISHLTELFLQVCERHPNYRDYSRSDLRAALVEMAACLPVYRTYVRPGEGAGTNSDVYSATENEEGGFSAQDKAYLLEACEAAKANRADLDPRLFDFLRDVLLLRVRGAVEAELLERFQQFSGPVMAKGVEDTTFYLFNRFISLNEVGGDPGRFGMPLEAFHAACLEAQARWPLAMLATSTHDTKRSEDVRARLDVLSERHAAWIEAVTRWAKLNEPHRTLRDPANPAGERWPDRNSEYLLYQVLVGAWPIEAERVLAYMEKAGREAKVYTSWTAVNVEYEKAVADFVRAVMADQRFTDDLETFVAEILEAGRINALAQTLLKLTTPGIPDLYQGTELWNLALVDPDNRRPVDYALRQGLLEQLSSETTPEAVLNGMEVGLPKLWVIRQALALRAEQPQWFGAQSSYTPLYASHSLPAVQAVDEDKTGSEEGWMVAVTGTVQAAERPAEAQPEAAIAFLRGENVLVVVPRLVTRYRQDWAALRLRLPPGLWRNRLTHDLFQRESIPLDELFGRFPAALLVKEG